MFLNIVVTYCDFCVTAKSPHRSRTSMYAPSADFSCFLNCVQNPALKLLPDWKFWGNCFLGESGNFFLKIILQSQSLFRIVFVCTLESRLKTIPIVYYYEKYLWGKSACKLCKLTSSANRNFYGEYQSLLVLYCGRRIY